MSFYTSLTGIKAAQTSLDVISHNLANVETTGFKRGRANFTDVFANSASVNPALTVGIGTRLDNVTQVFTQGPIEQTGAALDLAIAGDGFFATKSAVSGDVMFTRNGSFQVDEDGYIHRGASDRLQIFEVAADGTVDPTAGTIDAQIPDKNSDDSPFAGVMVSANGDVVVSYADGTNETIGRVALAAFTSPEGLRQMGASNWTTTGAAGTTTWGVPDSGRFGDMLSGVVERSNVDITEELVGLITAQRNFQANAKGIDTASQVTQTIVNLRT